jgi:hypothetical protein
MARTPTSAARCALRHRASTPTIDLTIVPGGPRANRWRPRAGGWSA